jgi:NosR/NirI family nitrous oxide reductase transcriptional regulator
MARTRGGRESSAPIRSAETGGDGGTPRNARTGAGGGSGRRGLPVLTLVLAAAVASAQPLVSPADEAALRRLLPEADHFELHDRGARHFRAFAAPESGAAPRLIALAFFTTDLAPRIYAYKGRIESLVAMDPGGRLIGVRVVHHDEPFGYFSIDLPGFAPQFAGKSILDRLEVGGDIDAVSRATITMEAAIRAIRQGARRLARDFLAEQSADR